MVAYSFKTQFVEPIQSDRKRQTVRAARSRHAKVGEAVQLYVGMRTRNCTKLVDPDPVCTAADIIQIWFDDQHCISRIKINGISLTASAMMQFAIDDGFDDTRDLSALDAMARFFWRITHAEPSYFVGYVIRWKPADEQEAMNGR